MGIRQHPVILSLLVAVAFLAPLGLAYLYLSGNSEEVSLKSETASAFQPTYVVRKSGQFIEQGDLPFLSPQPGKDFLLASWIRVRRSDSPVRMTYLTKFEPNSEAHNGYALAYIREGDKIRPQVYWTDESGKGGWYDFLPLRASARDWVLFATIYYQDKYLGLYGAVFSEIGLEPKLEMLGGYELSEIGAASSAASVRLGSHRVPELRLEVHQLLIHSFERVEHDWAAFLGSTLLGADPTSKIRGLTGERLILERLPKLRGAKGAGLEERGTEERGTEERGTEERGTEERGAKFVVLSEPRQ